MLKTCLRAELKGILDLAQTVNSGDSVQAVRMLSMPGSLPGVEANLHDESSKNLHKKFIEQASGLFEHPDISVDAPEKMLDLFNRFRILSPLRKGPFGVDDLNAQIKLHQSRKFRNRNAFMAPIMILNNDSRMELFNGEVGVLVKFKNEDDDDFFHEGDYAIFPGITNVPVRKLAAVLLPKFEYAYCLSVHKSQGSEFDHVLLLIPEGSEIFGREVLYTAITRARKKIEILCQEHTLVQTIRQHSLRLSGILDRMAIV